MAAETLSFYENTALSHSQWWLDAGPTSQMLAQHPDITDPISMVFTGAGRAIWPCLHAVMYWHNLLLIRTQCVHKPHQEYRAQPSSATFFCLRLCHIYMYTLWIFIKFDFTVYRRGLKTRTTTRSDKLMHTDAGVCLQGCQYSDAYVHDTT